MSGRTYNPVVRRLQGLVTAAHGVVLKASGGRLLGGLGPNRVAVLKTTGRRSGQTRSSPLFAYPDGEDYIVVASNGGTAGHPAWFLNLRSDPEGELSIMGKDLKVVATELTDEEREEWWPRVVAKYRFYDSYQKKTERKIPMVRLSPR